MRRLRTSRYASRTMGTNRLLMGLRPGLITDSLLVEGIESFQRMGEHTQAVRYVQESLRLGYVPGQSVFDSILNHALAQGYGDQVSHFFGVMFSLRGGLKASDEILKSLLTSCGNSQLLSLFEHIIEFDSFKCWQVSENEVILDLNKIPRSVEHPDVMGQAILNSWANVPTNAVLFKGGVSLRLLCGESSSAVADGLSKWTDVPIVEGSSVVVSAETLFNFHKNRINEIWTIYTSIRGFGFAGRYMTSDDH